MEIYREYYEAMTKNRFQVEETDGAFYVVDTVLNVVRSEDTESAALAELWAMRLEREFGTMSDSESRGEI